MNMLFASRAVLARKGSGARRGSRSSLGRSAFRDHAFPTAVAASAAAAARAAFRNAATAVAAVAALAAGFSAVATTLGLLGTVLGKQTAVAGRGFLTVALLGTVLGEQTAVAAATSKRTRVTAHEGDGNDRDEHRESKSEIPLHQNLQSRNGTRQCVRSSRHELINRSGTATGPQQTCGMPDRMDRPIPLLAEPTLTAGEAVPIRQSRLKSTSRLVKVKKVGGLAKIYGIR